MYLFSKSILVVLAGGMTKFPKTKEADASNIAAIIKGSKNLQKLIPLFRMAITSVLLAIFEVKKITEINMKSGLKRLAKKGIKFK